MAARAARRPEAIAPLSDAVSRWSPQTYRPGEANGPVDRLESGRDDRGEGVRDPVDPQQPPDVGAATNPRVDLCPDRGLEPGVVLVRGSRTLTDTSAWPAGAYVEGDSGVRRRC
jgi:hypothetical protein